MKKSELDSILKQARLPEISEESLEQFPQHVASRIRRSWSSSFSLSGGATAEGNTLKRELQRWFPQLAWAFALALCGLLAFAMIHRNTKMESKPGPETDSLASAKLIRETMALFPNRVRAIVQDERGLNLVLSDNDDVPNSPPLFVKICDGKNCSSLVTFSGQEVQIGGQKFTVLAAGGGEIILEGKEFAWSSASQDVPSGGLQISARPLFTGTM